jgi:predicted Zn-dependent protease
MYIRNNVVLAFVLLLLIVTGPVWAVTLQEEIEIGKKANEAILKQDKLYPDTHAQKKMQKLGAALVKHVKRKNIPYHFQILSQDKELNAFAVPGGYVYYTSGLWKQLNNDERAGVLAHEIIHVDQRHSLDAMLKFQRRRMWTDLALVLSGANSTIQNVAGMVNTLHELKYSRGDEKQADTMGVALLVKSKMNPAGLLMAMRKILRNEKKSGGESPAIFSSHPPTKERLAYLEKMLRDMHVKVPK